MPTSSPVIFTGMRELNRDLKATGPAVVKQMRIGLRIAVEPIKKDAEALAQSDISGMRRAKRKPPPWSVQRIGQNSREVYMVPKEKGARGVTESKRRRPAFASLLLGRSYDPAVEANRGQVANTVEHLVSVVTREF